MPYLEKLKQLPTDGCYVARKHPSGKTWIKTFSDPCERVEQEVNELNAGIDPDIGIQTRYFVWCPVPDDHGAVTEPG